MKLKKLDTRGFSHEVLAMAFVVTFAVAGVGYMVLSHADPGSSCSNGPAYVNLWGGGAPPAGQLEPLNDYWSASLNDNYYTVSRADSNFAAFGYCFTGTEGNAYSSQVSGTLPLNEYWSPSLSKHFFTLYPSLEPFRTCQSCNYKYESITAYLAPADSGGQISGTEPLYRFANPATGGHYFSTVNDGPRKGYPNSEGPGGYVWAPVSAAPTPPSPAAAPSTRSNSSSNRGASTPARSNVPTAVHSNTLSGPSTDSTSRGSTVATSNQRATDQQTPARNNGHVTKINSPRKPWFCVPIINSFVRQCKTF